MWRYRLRREALLTTLLLLLSIAALTVILAQTRSNLELHKANQLMIEVIREQRTELEAVKEINYKLVHRFDIYVPSEEDLR